MAAEVSQAGRYLLKVIQAGVLAGSQNLAVWLHSDQSFVDFRGPAELFSPDLLKAPNPPESARHRLASAIQSALRFGHPQVRLYFWSSGGSYALVAGNHNVTVTALESPPPGGEFPEDGTGLFRFCLSRDMVSRHSSRMGEHEAIYNRALFAPSRVYLDGRPTPNFWPAARFCRTGWYRTYSKAFWLAQRQVGGTTQCEQPRFGLAQQVEGERPALLAIPISMSGPGRIFFVKHGVTMDPIQFDLGCPGLVAVARDDTLPTDDDKLKVLESDALAGWSSYLRGHALELVRDTRTFIPELAYPPPDSSGLVGWFSGNEDSDRAFVDSIRERLG